MILAIESPTILELAMMADLPPEVRLDEEAIRRHIRRCGAFLTTMFNEEGDEVVEWIDVIAKEHLTTTAKEELSLDLNDVQHGIIALRCLEHVRHIFPAKADAVGNDDTQQIEEEDAGHVDQEETTVSPIEAEQSPEGSASVPNAVVKETECPDVEAAGDTSHVPEDQQAPQMIEEAPEDPSEEEPTAPLEPESFLDYAVDHWLDHAMQAPPDMVEEFDLTDEFWSKKSSTRDQWFEQWWKTKSRYPGLADLTPLHLAALSGFAALLEHLLENGRNEYLHAEDNSNSTPLEWACDNGNIRIVDRLLKAGAEINRPTGRSALAEAALNGHTEIVQFLLDQGADKDWRGKNSDGTPLYIAAEIGSTEIVYELLERNADPNLKDGFHLRPLNVAAYLGFTEVVEILLRHGVDTEPDDAYRYGTALGAAARRGHADIVRRLLEEGSDANQEMKTYRTPIVAAAAYGYADVVEILLQYKAKGPSLEHALEIAAQNGRADAVKALLASGYSLPHEKAFQKAATHGRDDVIEVLQTLGTNQTMLSMALFDASDQEMGSTVNLLLKLGADPNAEGKVYAQLSLFKIATNPIIDTVMLWKRRLLMAALA